jgi:hypothetical protein
MRFDKRQPVLNPQQVERLPEFQPLNDQQKTFVLLVASGTPFVTAVQGAYECRDARSARCFGYEIMRRRRLQPIFNRIFGGEKDDNKAEFLNRLEKLLRRGSKVTDAEVNALILYGVMNNFLPPDYHRQSLQEKLNDLGIQIPAGEIENE